jgi:drug/metabolite transporter (DMT)-like permease
VTRVGQLLFVIAFVAGSFHFLRRGRDWRAVGFMLIAVGWALLFADWLLEQLVGPAYVFGVLAILVAGSVTIVYGIVQDELRSEPDLEALLGG